MLMSPSRNDEGGMALIAAVLVMMVCTILVAATMVLAQHTAQRSGLNRDHSAAIHAAEAGIEAELATLSGGSCPTAGAETVLPDQNLPKESYKVLAPTSCTSPNALIGAVGYVPNATHPVATATIMAHVDWGQGASPSTGNYGGYVFPDAVFTNGTLTATAGKLSVFGVGGTVPSISANGAISINDTGSPVGQLDGGLHGWSTINVTNAQIGGTVIGADVTLSSVRVQGDVTSTGNLNLDSNTTVTGNVAFGGTNYSTSPTVTGTYPTTPTSTTPKTKRPTPIFTDNKPEISTLVLGAATTPNASCPGSGNLTFYDYTSGGSCDYNPATINGTVIVIAHGGTLKVQVPQTSAGQLYVVNDAGDIQLTGSNSTMPVFAWASGTVTLKGGGLVGQVAAGVAVTTTADTTLTFFAPAVPMPDFAFPGGYSTPTLGYAATIAYEYPCPTTAAC
ncbi:MAG: hypothetical protein M3N98_08815 [Actinomycetota bacterium]|nr:hypothetical protein [Actinomycetota bacterium]